MDGCHERFQDVNRAEDLGFIANACLHHLDERINHQDELEMREGIALDDAILKSNFTDLLVRPV